MRHKNDRFAAVRRVCTPPHPFLDPLVHIYPNVSVKQSYIIVTWIISEAVKVNRLFLWSASRGLLQITVYCLYIVEQAPVVARVKMTSPSVWPCSRLPCWQITSYKTRHNEMVITRVSDANAKDRFLGKWIKSHRTSSKNIRLEKNTDISSK